MLTFDEEAYYKLSYGSKFYFLKNWHLTDYSEDDNLLILDKFLEFGPDYLGELREILGYSRVGWTTKIHDRMLIVHKSLNIRAEV